MCFPLCSVAFVALVSILGLAFLLGAAFACKTWQRDTLGEDVIVSNEYGTCMLLGKWRGALVYVLHAFPAARCAWGAARLCAPAFFLLHCCVSRAEPRVPSGGPLVLEHPSWLLVHPLPPRVLCVCWCVNEGAPAPRCAHALHFVKVLGFAQARATGGGGTRARAQT